MSSNVLASTDRQFVEERLLVGLYNGPLLQNNELLDMLEDVDVRIVKQRTLLHVGVELGKADWVEELLARGADLDLKDDSHVTALSSAEELYLQFPADSDRSQVLKLVTLAHRRDQAMTHRINASSNRSDAQTAPIDRTELDMASLKASVDSLRQQMKSLVSQSRSSLEELKGQVCGRDVLLRCLEEAVTSTAENVTLMKLVVGGETVASPLPSDPTVARRECVDAMMRKTQIVFGEGIDRMRMFYERIYDEDDCTRCILMFLSGEDRLKVLVDCDNYVIGRMKQKVVDLDGSECNGSFLESFADLNEDTVYLGEGGSWRSEGTLAGWLALSLSLVSMKLAFCNGGRPYEQGDVGQEGEFQRALQESVDRGRDWRIGWALKKNTQLATESYLAAYVPWIIAEHGSVEGRRELWEQVPLLFNFFWDRIVPMLLSKTRG